jgi:hypothetical protein
MDMTTDDITFVIRRVVCAFIWIVMFLNQDNIKKEIASNGN